jgi:hypothetical protein
MGLTPRRRPRGELRCIDTAARALLDCMGSQERMPTYAALRAAGRSDLLYALGLHGKRALGERVEALRHSAQGQEETRACTDECD